MRYILESRIDTTSEKAKKSFLCIGRERRTIHWQALKDNGGKHLRTMAGLMNSDNCFPLQHVAN
jgi:hypothetical protein